MDTCSVPRGQGRLRRELAWLVLKGRELAARKQGEVFMCSYHVLGMACVWRAWSVRLRPVPSEMLHEEGESVHFYCGN